MYIHVYVHVCVYISVRVCAEGSDCQGRTCTPYHESKVGEIKQFHHLLKSDSILPLLLPLLLLSPTLHPHTQNKRCAAELSTQTIERELIASPQNNSNELRCVTMYYIMCRYRLHVFVYFHSGRVVFERSIEEKPNH